MLPFLKDRHEGSASTPSETIKREPDEESFEMLDAVVEDMMMAFEQKDKSMLKGALEALVEHIQSQDEEQDEQYYE